MIYKIRKNAFTVIAVVIASIFTALKVAYTISVPLWFDESLTYFYVRAVTFTEMIYRITMYEQTPFLFYWLERAFLNVINNFSPFWLRALPMFFSFLSPFMLYFVSIEAFGNKKIAFFSSLFLFISTFYTFMTCDARGYSLAVFFILSGLYFYFRLLKEDKYSFIFFCLSWIIAVKIHYFSVIILTVIFIYSIVKKFIPDLFIGFLLVMLSFIPDLLELSLVLKNPPFGPGVASLRDVPELFYVLFSGYSLEFLQMFYWYALAVISVILFFIPLFAFLIIPRRQDYPGSVSDMAGNEKSVTSSLTLFYVIFTTVFLSTFVLSQVSRFNLFSTRHMVLILPFYCMIVTFALCRIKSRAVTFTAGIMILLLNFTSTFNLISKPYLQRNDFRAVTAMLSDRLQPGDGIVLVNGYNKYLLEYYAPTLNIERCIFIEKGDAVKFNITHLRPYKRVWLILSHPRMTDPEMLVSRKINSSFPSLGFCSIKKNNPEFSIYMILYEIRK